MRRILDRLTYANVTASLALVVALGGTSAYAAQQLAKNSVGSPQIKNGAVTSTDVKDKTLLGKDVKDGGLSGADLKDDSITDDQVDEDSLDTVPDAAELDGTPADEIPVVGDVVSGAFPLNDSLEANVSGYGNFYLYCSDTYDEVTYGYTPNSALHGGTDGMRAWFANGVFGTPSMTIYNHDVTETSATIAGDERIQVEQTITSDDDDKAIRISAQGWYEGTQCHGSIQATVLR